MAGSPCSDAVTQPSVDDRSHRFNEAVARAGSGAGGIQKAEIVVVEIELGAAVWVCGVDPLAAAEGPVAASLMH